jgi:hypothetical protein
VRGSNALFQEMAGGPRDPRPQGCGCARAGKAWNVQSAGGNAAGGTECIATATGIVAASNGQ